MITIEYKNKNNAIIELNKNNISWIYDPVTWKIKVNDNLNIK